MRRALAALLVLGLAGGIAGWLLTAPRPLNSATIAAMPDDNAVQGETIFWAGGCASCHAAPGADGDARLVLAGGLELGSPFGTFVAPNISPSKEHGIGAWNLADFANAMLAGVGPDGGHLYPAFPYASYSNMTHQDVSDLFAFLKTLPVSENVPGPNRLPFPFSIRRAVGGWKLLFFNGLAGNPRPDIDLSDPVVARGSYLVNGPGHCGECHTPRNLIGGWKSDAWLSGAKNPEGEGRIPNITPGGGIKDWSADDIASYLETGFTPDFDSVGGSMVAVQKNMAHLTKEDRAAIAAYLKAIPARPDGA